MSQMRRCRTFAVCNGEARKVEMRLYTLRFVVEYLDASVTTMRVEGSLVAYCFRCGTDMR